MESGARQRVREVVFMDVAVQDNSKSSPLINSVSVNRCLTAQFTAHHLEAVKSSLPTIVCDSRMNHDHALRSTLVILSSLIQSGTFSCSESISVLMETFFDSICVKYECLIEFLCLFLGNGLYQEARDEYSDHWSRNELKYYTVALFEPITTGLVKLVSFLKILDSLYSEMSLSQSDAQMDMELNQVLSNFIAVIKRGPGPFDFLIPRILDIYLHQGLLDEALECLVTYKNFNRDNYHVYIYIFRFLAEFEKDFPEAEKTNRKCFARIAELSPCCPLLIEILDHCEIEPVSCCKVLMEFVDYLPNKNNPEAWQKLSVYLDKLDPDGVESIRSHYEAMYSDYWFTYQWRGKGSLDNPDLLHWKHQVMLELTEKTKTQPSPSSNVGDHEDAIKDPDLTNSHEETGDGGQLRDSDYSGETEIDDQMD